MSSSGVVVETQSVRQVHPSEFDTILVAGGEGAENPEKEQILVEWLRRCPGSTRRVGSICTGAFLLAEAGILKGKRATTHWAYCDALALRYPDIEVESDPIFLSQAGVWTSAGVTSGIDLALAMVQEDWGRELALRTAQWLVVFLQRPGGQAQFSVPLKGQRGHSGPIPKLASWIVDNPAADLRLPALAERARMTERTLHRSFTKSVGCTPAEFVEQVRVELARRLLEETETDVANVALKSGFFHAERMRRAFLRNLGVCPSMYRERFNRAPAAQRASPATRLPAHQAS